MKLKLLSTIGLLIFCGSALPLLAQSDVTNLAFNIKAPESIVGSYEVRGTTDFGPGITNPICGELVWAGSEEALGCDAISADLSDQIVLIRRGDCFFSQKVFRAQEAGASAVVVVNHNTDPTSGPDATTGMSGADFADDVTIAAVFVSYNTGQAITTAMKNGDKVEIAIELATFFDAFGPFSYSTPQSQAVAMDNMGIFVVNRGLADKVGVETKLEITDPNGVVTEIVTIDDIPAGGDTVRVTFDSYLPEAIGKYQMKYISGLEERFVFKEFEVTEKTWAADDGNVISAIGDSTNFADANLFYQFGSLVLAGADEIATHVTFGLGNGAEIFTGEESADFIAVAVYNADANADGILNDLTGSDFSSLGDPIGIGFYEILGDETIDNLLTVALEDPLVIEDGEAYYVSVAYDGVDAATGVSPQFAATKNIPYPGVLVTPLALDDLYSGWAGGTLVCRLHLEGFSSSVEDFKPLGNDKLTIFSNPIENGRLSFELELEDVSQNVNFMLRNLEGKLVKQLSYQNVNRVDENIDIKGIPAGTYFLNVHTDEGFASKKIVVID